jgi:subtilisin family serine protease
MRTRAHTVVCRPVVLLAATALGVSGLSAMTGTLAAAAAPEAATVALPAIPGQLLVGYSIAATASERERARARAGGQVAEQVVPAGADRREVELVNLPAGKDRGQAIRELQSDLAVAYAEPNWLVQHAARTPGSGSRSVQSTDTASSDPYYTNGSLWGMYGDLTSPANQHGSQAGEAWSAGRSGSSTIVVAVIDEGIQVTHPDLDANVWVNPRDPRDGMDNDGNGYVDDLHGWDFVSNDNTVYDGGSRGSVDKHGTHVAGSIGAEANGTGVVGVNWDINLVSLKFLGRNGGTTANAIKAVDYATDLKKRHNIDLVATNNSWGGGGFSRSLYDAIERANAANILFVAAAGNGGSDGIGDDNDKTPHYPSSYANTNILAVAAINSTGRMPTWSNFGLTSVDLGAPGAAVHSTLPFNSYGSYSGTSMATPHVTGGVALLAAANPTSRGAALKNGILNSAVRTDSLGGKVVTGGRLNVGG